MTLPEFLSRDDLGWIHLTGHRIGLNHVVRCYNEGFSPEMIAGQFPTLSLALIHKVIAFYLENQAGVDARMAEDDRELERLAAAAPKSPGLAELRRRMAQIQAQGQRPAQAS